MTYIFPSTLIVCPNDPTPKITELLSQLHHQFNPNNPDLKLIDLNWSIDQVRTLKNFLSQKPYNHRSKVVIIKDAQNLTPEAQHALLKVLEEPGVDNYLILTTNQPHSLLATIHSRCHLIKLSSTNQTSSQAKMAISGILKTDLNTVDQLALDKNTALPFLENQLGLFQQQLITHPEPQTARLIKRLILAIQMLNANVDPRSALDYFFLS